MEWSRREVLQNVTGSIGAAAVFGLPAVAAGQTKGRPRPADEPFGYCLNTSTIRGNQLDIVKVVEAVGRAGFHAIEPWITELDAYTKAGGSLKDLGKRIADAGLTVENAIAFNSVLTDDAAQRAASLEALKTDMDKVAQIGGTRIATVA
jgi:sugar phosphate isomerase/epimerase